MNVIGIDWAIFAVIFVIILAIAIYVNTHVKSVADFLVSGRKVRMWLNLGAGIAGEIGLISIASTCEQGYMRGFAFILIGLIAKFVTIPLFGIFGFGIERFRATKAMSVPQYIEMRYSKRLRILTGMFNSMAGVLQMTIFPIVGANFIKVLIKAPDSVMLAGLEIQSTWIIMAILLTCAVIFTHFGGYITLIVTNFFQMIIIMVSIFWLFFVLMEDIGIQKYWSSLENAKGVAGFYPFGKGSEYGIFYFFWLLLMTILLQFSYGPYLQKMASADKPKTVRKSSLLGGLFSSGRSYIILGLGVAALAALGPEAQEGIDEITWKRMATPYYLSGVVPPVLMGFLLAGLLFADVSTTDQYILSWSTSIVNDCIIPFKKKPFSTKAHINAVKKTIVVLCILFFFCGIVYRPTMPLWEFMWLCANIIGGTGIAVLAGMYWRRATTAGAYAAVLISLILPLVDMAVRQILIRTELELPIELLMGIKYPWEPKYTGFGTYAIAALALVIISLSSKGKTKYWDLGKKVRELNK